MYIQSPNGEHLIKNAEGCRLTAYTCPAGKLTIGWGHRLYGAIPEGFTVTPQQAQAWYILDVEHVLEQLWGDYKELNQNQVDALVSFIYNIGIGAWHGSTAKRDLTLGDLQFVPEELKRWIHTDAGKILPGLVVRRAKEAALFTEKVA